MGFPFIVTARQSGEPLVREGRQFLGSPTVGAMRLAWPEVADDLADLLTRDGREWFGETRDPGVAPFPPFVPSGAGLGEPTGEGLSLPRW